MTPLSPMALRALDAARKTGIARVFERTHETAEKGAEIAETVWAAWFENGLRPARMAIDITCASDRPEWVEGVLPADWSKAWPEGSRLVRLFLFSDTLRGGGARHFCDVCDVPQLGLDARCECEPFKSGGFCSHVEAAMLLAARLGEREGVRADG